MHTHIEKHLCMCVMYIISCNHMFGKVIAVALSANISEYVCVWH